MVIGKDESPTSFPSPLSTLCYRPGLRSEKSNRAIASTLLVV